jgi:hypothetical protein
MKVVMWRCAQNKDGDFNLEDAKDFDRWDTECGHLLLALYDPWAPGDAPAASASGS